MLPIQGIDNIDTLPMDMDRMNEMMADASLCSEAPGGSEACAKDVNEAIKNDIPEPVGDLAKVGAKEEAAWQKG